MKKRELKEQKKKRNIGIGLKIRMMFLIIISVLLVVSGSSSYYKSSMLLEKNLKSTSLQLITKEAEILNTMVNAFERKADEFSRTDYVIEIAEGNLRSILMDRLYDSFENFMLSDEKAESIFIATNEGYMLSFPEKDLPKDYDPTNEAWYTEALNNNTVFVSEPFTDLEGKQIIRIMAPINKNKGTIGVVGIDILLSKLGEEVNTLKIGKEGYAVLLDEDSMILTDKNPDNIGERIDTTIEGEDTFSVSTAVDKLNCTLMATVNRNEIAEDTNDLIVNTLVIGAIAFVVAYIMSSYVSVRLSRNIKKLLEDFDKTKDGDFRVRSNIKSNDEIKLISEGFNSMVEEVDQLVSNLKHVSMDISDASVKLTNTAEEASASAQQVAISTDEIAKGAVEQSHEAEKGADMTSNLAERLVSLNKQRQVVLQSSTVVKEANNDGLQAVTQLQDKTREQNQAIERVERAIIELNDRSMKVNTILDSIENIAQQTNLLSLNASIEAARAGELGRGFAVVAGEIRNLAVSTSEATNEINRIINDIQNDTTNAVAIMKDVEMRSSEQAQSVGHVNTSFESISDAIMEIMDNIDNMVQSIEQMDKEKDMILFSIESVSSVSQQTAASSEQVSVAMHHQSTSVEEVAKAAEHLKQLSLQLDNNIAHIKWE